jgi:hypothetical protein
MYKPAAMLTATAWATAATPAGPWELALAMAAAAAVESPEAIAFAMDVAIATVL